MAKYPIYFLDYEKVTDLLLVFGADQAKYCLKFVLKLPRKSANDTRIPYHSECLYENNTYEVYGDVLSSVTRRVNSYYFSIEPVANDDDYFKTSIYIYPHDIYYIKNIFEQALTWFDLNNDIFTLKPDNSLNAANIEPIEFFNIRYDNKFIRLKPAVVSMKVRDEYQDMPGVAMSINNDDYSLYMNAGDFFALYWLITHTDMYGLASSMMSYIKTPPYGINMRYNDGLTEDDKYFDHSMYE